jgi:hypothetical protein
MVRRALFVASLASLAAACQMLLGSDSSESPGSGDAGDDASRESGSTDTGPTTDAAATFVCPPFQTPGVACTTFDDLPRRGTFTDIIKQKTEITYPEDDARSPPAAMQVRTIEPGDQEIGQVLLDDIDASTVDCELEFSIDGRPSVETASLGLFAYELAAAPPDNYIAMYIRPNGQPELDTSDAAAALVAHPGWTHLRVSLAPSGEGSIVTSVIDHDAASGRSLQLTPAPRVIRVGIGVNYEIAGWTVRLDNVKCTYQ